mmetsp:Transcript_115417/g.337511  ORF Transcript_115417/g.337511 Transcript_115417/m.337511 type:complete len:288 (+) Transcript_115417:3234-4097(+)
MTLVHWQGHRPCPFRLALQEPIQEPPPIDLPAVRDRQGRQDLQSRRHTVFGESRPKPLQEAVLVPLICAKSRIHGQLRLWSSTCGSFPRRGAGQRADHNKMVRWSEESRRGTDSGQCSQRSLDLTQLNADTIELHLVVCAPQELQAAISSPSSKISGAVSLARSVRVVHKLLLSEFRTPPVAGGDERAAKEQLSLGEDWAEILEPLCRAGRAEDKRVLDGHTNRTAEEMLHCWSWWKLQHRHAALCRTIQIHELCLGQTAQGRQGCACLQCFPAGNNQLKGRQIPAI